VLIVTQDFDDFFFHAAEESNIEEGMFGAGAHSDWGFLTLLITDDVPGLQVCFVLNPYAKASLFTLSAFLRHFIYNWKTCITWKNFKYVHKSWAEEIREGRS